MSFWDSLWGRSKPPPATIDDLFTVPQAAVTLQLAGFEFTGRGSVCFRDSEGSADDAAIGRAERMIQLDSSATVQREKDSYGFTWLTVERKAHQVAELVTDLHALNTSLIDEGFGSALLCSTFILQHQGTHAALVYLFKRGTFYPFVPADSVARRRDNAVELQMRGVIADELPVEKDLSRWLAIWGAPGL